MRRIGIVTYSLAGGGAERSAIRLAREFIALGNAVDFLLAAREGDYFHLIPDECRVFVAGRPGASYWVKCVANYARENKPDVLLGIMEGAAITALRAAKRIDYRGRVVARIPNHFSLHYQRSERWKQRYLMGFAVRWYLPRAHAVVAISEGVRKDIIRSARLRPCLVHTIYNPAFGEDAVGSSRDTESEFVHPFLIRNRAWLTVVTAGRLTEQKNQRLLLEAIYEANKHRDVRLLVLGQGELERDLKDFARARGINEKVEFLGFVARPEKFFKGADVFALSSNWEGLGNVLIEALSTGVPVVSTDCPSGPHEVLGGGEFGQLVPPGDAKALSRAILQAPDYVVNRDDLRAQLSQFEASTVAKQYLRVMSG